MKKIRINCTLLISVLIVGILISLTGYLFYRHRSIKDSVFIPGTNIAVSLKYQENDKWSNIKNYDGYGEVRIFFDEDGRQYKYREC